MVVFIGAEVLRRVVLVADEVDPLLAGGHGVGTPHPQLSNGVLDSSNYLSTEIAKFCAPSVELLGADDVPQLQVLERSAMELICWISVASACVISAAAIA